MSLREKYTTDRSMQKSHGPDILPGEEKQIKKQKAANPSQRKVLHLQQSIETARLKEAEKTVEAIVKEMKRDW